MTPAQYQHAGEIFHAALERPPGDRRAFLTDECQGDEALRQEIESLLAYVSVSAPFLESPAMEVVAALISQDEPSVPLTGRIGHYEVVSPIGSGGMGDVYRARDAILGRDVALKLPRRALIVDLDAVRRFEHEARAASSLNHPNIVTIHEIGEAAGRRFIAMELVEGQSLATMIGRPLAANALSRIGSQLAQALAVAHAAGIVHGDIKPQNVMVRSDGYVKVLDFGVARLVAPMSGTKGLPAATPGVIAGTPRYMSPEQTRGEATTGASDVFACGVMLYELATGRHPFAAESKAELWRAITTADPPPTGGGPRIPVELERLLLRMLEKHPPARPTAGEVEVALAAIAATPHTDPRPLADVQSGAIMPAPATPAPAPAPTSVTLPAARRSYRRGSVVTAAAVLFVTGVSIVWQLQRADYFWRNPLASARTERVTDFEGEEVDAAISPNGKVVVFLADRGGPFDVWRSEIGTSAFVNITNGKAPAPNPAAIRRVGFFDDGHIWISEGKGSGPYTLWMAPVLGGEPRLFLAGAMEPAWSPDGKAMAYHTAEPADPIYVADRNGRSPKRIFTAEPGNHCHYLTWSPDGRFLYFVMGRPTTDEMDIWRIPVFTTPPVTPERITTHNARVAYLGWLDARTLIYSATAHDGSGQWLYALDSDHRIPHRVSSGIAEQYLSVAVSNTEPRRVIAAVATPTANLWTVPISDHVQTEADVRRFSLANTRAVSPRAAADYLLFLSSRSGADGLWKLRDGAVTELWKGRDGGVVATPAISPDGTQVCFASREQGRSHLYLMSADGANVRRLTDGFDVRGAASWSPDGKWITVAANNGTGTYVYKVPVNGGSPVRLTDTASYNPLWSPDGRFIVYSEPLQGSTFTTKAITPDKVSVPIPDIRVSYLASTPYRFAPDGNALIFLKEGAFVGGDRNFYVTDLKTGQERQLTNLQAGFLTRSFDLLPGGRIIFDRLRESSNLALIDLVR